MVRIIWNVWQVTWLNFHLSNSTILPQRTLSVCTVRDVFFSLSLLLFFVLFLRMSQQKKRKEMKIPIEYKNIFRFNQNKFQKLRIDMVFFTLKNHLKWKYTRKSPVWDRERRNDNEEKKTDVIIFVFFVQGFSSCNWISIYYFWVQNFDWY